MHYLSAISLGMLYTVIAEGLVFKFALGKSGLDMWAKIFFLNVASFAIAISIAVSCFFSLGWSFATSWGTAHWFLLIVLCEFLPMAILFGKYGFRRIFTLLIFANFLSSMLLCYLVTFAPQALLLPSMEMSEHEYKVSERIGIIKDALERYYTNKGEYPAYIFGGDQVSWRKSYDSLDPLLREGYLENYPINPFHLGRAYFIPRRKGDFGSYFWGLDSENFKHLKTNWKSVVRDDPRFGFRGTRMGNILSNLAIPASTFKRDYHVYRGTKDHQYFLPGAFLYRAFDTDGDGRHDSYILAGFGSEDTVGMDIYNQSENRVTYQVAGTGELYPGNADRKYDGVIIVETGGFKKWRE